MTSRLCDRDGFTLVETLIAVAVVAFVSVALQRGLVSARLALSRAHAAVAAEAVARGILETRLYDLASTAGERRGVTDGLQWVVKSEPLDLPFSIPPQVPPATGVRVSPTEPSPPQEVAPPQQQEPQALWTPLRVTIAVDPGAGSPITVETVHLARAL